MILEYKISKSTSFSSEEIINKILLIIEKRNYGIVEITKKSVSFNAHTGGFIGNWEHVRRMKKGKFEIINNGNSNIVLFEYLPIPVSEYIWVAIISSFPVGFGIINKVYAVGLISWLFIGQLLFKRYNLKTIANEMLTEAVS